VTDASLDRPDSQFHAYLMSLAYIFGTELDTIPAETPYLFANPEFIESWRPRVMDRGRPRIGFVCSGAPSFKNDHNRSIPLSAFAELLELPFDFHCLQKVIRADDEAIAEQYPNFYLHSQAIDSFDDTAALVEHMDLVISVDTSVAHLVGALGKPLWLMIPYTPDNRWFLDRSDSPWYPTATLYRQPERGLWTPVINRIRADLLKRFARAIT
jgi:ADP-heptose:LPS heptosyltransferase